MNFLDTSFEEVQKYDIKHLVKNEEIYIGTCTTIKEAIKIVIKYLKSKNLHSNTYSALTEYENYKKIRNGDNYFRLYKH